MKYKSSYYNTVLQYEEKLIVFNSISGQLLTFDAVSGEKAKEILAFPNDYPDDEIFRHLLKHGCIIEEGCDELVAVEEIERRSYLNDDELFLIVLPTEQCNFRCKYCYESFVKKEMSEHTQAELIKFVKTRVGSVKSMTVEWFGGEPLLSEKVIANLSGAFMQICQEHGIPYAASMTTNGYRLDAAMVNRLKNYHVLHYQITIDGLEDTHDKQRVRADGSGTWRQIINNLRDIRDNVKSSMVHIMLRTNLSKPIINEIDEYLNFLEQEFKNDRRFHFLWRMAGDWDNMQDQSFESQFCSPDDYYNVLSMASQRRFSNRKLRDMLIPGGLVCYASKYNSFVIGSDGVIHKCTLGLDEAKNNVGYLGGTKEIQDEMWVYPSDFLDEKCVKCKKRPICQGKRSCPNSNICICGPDVSNFEQILINLVQSDNKVIKYSSEKE